MRRLTETLRLWSRLRRIEKYLVSSGDFRARELAATERALNALDGRVKTLEAIAHPPVMIDPILDEKIAEAMARAGARDPDEATGHHARLRNGRIEISIEVDALPMIVWGSCAAHASVLSTMALRVTDAEAFARDLVGELSKESETGNTRISAMFDAAIAAAVENGALGIEIISEDEFSADYGRLHPARSAARAAARPQRSEDATARSEGEQTE
jgi:hypothetical protein